MSLIRIVANTHRWGGGEMSVMTIMRMLVDDGHDVHLHPTGSVGQAVRQIRGVSIWPRFSAIETIHPCSCDVLFFYANNFIYQLPQHQKQWQYLWRRSRRRVMCLNFDIAHASEEWFLREWDLVLFLNTSRESQFPKCGVKTASLAPAVDLEPFLQIKPDYSRLNIMRHTRHTKHCQDAVEITGRVKDLVPEAHFWFLGPPPDIEKTYRTDPRFHLFPEFSISVPEFLAHGSLLWYRLHQTMADQGPRVVVEAMAAGLPCIVDDRDGARDRVTEETGWKCQDNDDYVRAIELITANPSILAEKGAAARQRAITHFNPRRWIDHILGAMIRK